MVMTYESAITIYICGEWHEYALAIECLTFVYDDDSVMSYNDI